MAFSDLGQHLTNAIWTDGNILAGISTFARGCWQGRPFMGKIVD